MKTIRYGFLAFALCAWAAAQAPALPPSKAVAGLAGLGFTVFKEPQALPAFSLPGLDGKKVGPGDYKGKYLLLNFWATWCPPCRAEMPSIADFWAKYKGSRIGVLAVSVNEAEKTVKDFQAKNKYPFPIVLDSDNAVSGAFVGRGIPTTYLIDPEGRAVAGMVGGREWNLPEVYKVFDALAAQ